MQDVADNSDGQSAQITLGAAGSSAYRSSPLSGMLMPSSPAFTTGILQVLRRKLRRTRRRVSHHDTVGLERL